MDVETGYIFFCWTLKTHSLFNGRDNLRVKRQKKIFQTKGYEKHAAVAILISDKLDFNPKLTRHGREGYYTLVKDKTNQTRPGRILHTHQRQKLSRHSREGYYTFVKYKMYDEYPEILDFHAPSTRTPKFT